MMGIILMYFDRKKIMQNPESPPKYNEIISTSKLLSPKTMVLQLTYIVSSEKAALFLLPEKFALKYDVPDYINLYNKMCKAIGRR